MLVLERTYHDDRTTGVLHAYHGHVIETLELPWRGNARAVSCVPEGRYTLRRDLSGRHRFYRLDDGQVAPRSAIELHYADRVTQLEGCIGVTTHEALWFLVGSLPAWDVLWIRSETGEPDVDGGEGPV